MYLYPFGLNGTKVVPAKTVVGGKGHHLVDMTHKGFTVPPGFVIPVSASQKYRKSGSALIEDAMPSVMERLEAMKEHFGYMPLLSVRSGAAVSMPGMMDTILNVGLSQDNLQEWEGRIGKRAARDSMRRLLQMMGETVHGIEGDLFDRHIMESRVIEGVENDSEISEDGLLALIQSFRDVYASKGKAIPETLESQLECSISAVFDSWDSPRAVSYREMHGLNDLKGTAVVIQAMVFGNMNDRSGSGVAFTRDPSTGDNNIVGEFMVNAQGEDVVSGSRTPMNLVDLGEDWADMLLELKDVSHRLEDAYRDMMDIEFTVQDGKMYLLQCRSGKRTAKAAFAIASDMSVSHKFDARDMLTLDQYWDTNRPCIDPSFDTKPLAVGLPGGGGVVCGRIALSTGQAESFDGPVILVRKETTPDDIDGMIASVGVLTSTGGITSHAAVVARSMGKSCVTGIGELKIEDEAHKICIDDEYMYAGDFISIDGDTGGVWKGKVPVIQGGDDKAVSGFESRAMEELDVMMKTDHLSSGKNERIMLAEMWGDISRTKKLLNELKEKDLENVLLDFKRPESFRSDKDTLLWDAFGRDERSSREYVDMVIQFLRENADMMKGLSVCNLESEHDAVLLREAGISVCTKARTVGDLLSGEALVVDDDFVDDVLGGKEVLNKLESAFGKVDVMKDAMPKEIAFVKWLLSR